MVEIFDFSYSWNLVTHSSKRTMMPITAAEEFWLEDNINRLRGIYASVLPGQRMVEQFLHYSMTGAPVTLEFIRSSQRLFLERFRQVAKSLLEECGQNGNLDAEQKYTVFGANAAKAAMLTNFLLESQDSPEDQFKVAVGEGEYAKWLSSYGSFPGVHKLSASVFSSLAQSNGSSGSDGNTDQKSNPDGLFLPAEPQQFQPSMKNNILLQKSAVEETAQRNVPSMMPGISQMDSKTPCPPCIPGTMEFIKASHRLVGLVGSDQNTYTLLMLLVLTGGGVPALFPMYSRFLNILQRQCLTAGNDSVLQQLQQGLKDADRMLEVMWPMMEAMNKLPSNFRQD